ncbi:hypothetical protein EDD15DRAFT_2262796, partial [Pisolithus albus]
MGVRAHAIKLAKHTVAECWFLFCARSRLAVVLVIFWFTPMIAALAAQSDANNSQPVWQPMRKCSQDTVDSRGEGAKCYVIRPAGRRGV